MQAQNQQHRPGWRPRGRAGARRSWPYRMRGTRSALELRCNAGENILPERCALELKRCTLVVQTQLIHRHQFDQRSCAALVKHLHVVRRDRKVGAPSASCG
jgi:hypothetical protein